MRKYTSRAFAALLPGVFLYQAGSCIFYGGPEIDALSVICLVAGATLLIMASDMDCNPIYRIAGARQRGRINENQFRRT